LQKLKTVVEAGTVERVPTIEE